MAIEPVPLATMSVVLRAPFALDGTRARRAPPTRRARFETGDERYSWMNKIQAVAKGPGRRQ